MFSRSFRGRTNFFSFPGLVAPTTRRIIGNLKDIGTKNPFLYFDSPQGGMKLFGTIVFPRNKYFTLQFSKGGKHVLYDNCFDNMNSVLKNKLSRNILVQPWRSLCTIPQIRSGSRDVKELLVTGGNRAQKMVGIWLFGSAAWVFSMVVLGGITRLTRSGLSMTDWKFTGNLPPFSKEKWRLEFEKYKQSPEYKRVNKGMNIEDFKFIYWMEYSHRMWGRGLAVVFALPFSYFIFKRYITLRLGLRLSAFFVLGAGQGFIGWWMVKSGLEEPESVYDQPRVSPYRLAAHLTSAFVIYTGLLWTALSAVMPNPFAESIAWVSGAAKVRRLVLPVSLLAGVTVVSGSFVAGNDAGRAYNTFPMMGDTWIPNDILSLKPLIRNFFENTSTVQFQHRILALTTFTSTVLLWLRSKKLDIDPVVRTLIGNVMGMASLQVVLGISTLVSYVPVSLGTAHQAGALTLMTLLILLFHMVRRPSPFAIKALASSISTVKI